MEIKSENLNFLPFSLTHLIFRQLNSKKDLLSCLIVCKAWNKAFKDNMQSVLEDLVKKWYNQDLEYLYLWISLKQNYSHLSLNSCNLPIFILQTRIHFGKQEKLKCYLTVDKFAAQIGEEINFTLNVVNISSSTCSISVGTGYNLQACHYFCGGRNMFILEENQTQKMNQTRPTYFPYDIKKGTYVGTIFSCGTGMEHFQHKLIPNASIQFQIPVKYLCNRKLSVFGLQTSNYHFYIKNLPQRIYVAFYATLFEENPHEPSTFAISNLVPLKLSIDSLLCATSMPTFSQYLTRTMTSKEAIHFLRSNGVSQLSGRVEI